MRRQYRIQLPGTNGSWDKRFNESHGSLCPLQELRNMVIDCGVDSEVIPELSSKVMKHQISPIIN